MSEVAEDNERLRVTLEQASREIALVDEMGRLAERRRGGFSGILVGEDEIARRYQCLDGEREHLRKTRLAKMKVLNAPVWEGWSHALIPHTPTKVGGSILDGGFCLDCGAPSDHPAHGAAPAEREGEP